MKKLLMTVLLLGSVFALGFTLDIAAGAISVPHIEKSTWSGAVSTTDLNKRYWIGASGTTAATDKTVNSPPGGRVGVPALWWQGWRDGEG